MAEEFRGQSIHADPIEVGDDDNTSEEYYEQRQDEDPDEDSSDDDESESGYESSEHNSLQISTKSLSGSILDYPIENGRRYCDSGEGAYFMPNDEAEQIRLSIMHQIHLALLDGGLTKAPIRDDIGRVLDIGTGTGEWAIAMAEKYPHAEVVGTDLSAMQPDKVPENVFFEIDDAEQEWTYTQGFDLIHMRNLAGSFESWGKIYEQAFMHLNPGGYLEVLDFQMNQWATEMPDTPAAVYSGALKSASDKAGRPLGIGHLKKPRARQAGFVDVQIGFMALPLGTWPQDPKLNWLGKMWLIGVLEGLEAMSMRHLTLQKSWPPEAVRDICGQVREQLTSSVDEIYTPV
ncbi:MAG: hypothetical protein M1813_004156 [Trichoglossum hirsutum]|nr:MAG: hypothetical protein M1813_004156 [Trichoglossum hirsutum]